jgi:hypothetical protein
MFDVPGLTPIFIYIRKFVQMINTVEIVRKVVYLIFDNHTVICPLFSAAISYFNTATANKNQIPSSRNKSGDLRLSTLET